MKNIKQSNYIGGQAVIEGVMMRGKNIYAMSVRNLNGDIITEINNIKDFSKISKILKLPIIRGIVAFLNSAIMGTKILMRSAEISGQNLEIDNNPSKFEKFLSEKLGDKLNDIIIYISVTISMILAIVLFFLLPVFLGSFFKSYVDIWFLSVVEGVIRIIIFLIYLFLISKMKDIQRVFQYHGAEHKTINCFESGEDLTIENVKKHTRLHKRCGTSFLFLVMLISMIVFFFIRTDVLIIRMISRILLVPVVAGISYEVLRWAGKSDSILVKIISYPGMCLQKMTTAEPDEKQIEIAISAIKVVLEEEKSE